MSDTTHAIVRQQVNERNDGGPAFPEVHQLDHHGQLVTACERGMSLRDWFAGMALQGMVYASYRRGPEFDYLPVAAQVREAYIYADNMLAHRDK